MDATPIPATTTPALPAKPSSPTAASTMMLAPATANATADPTAVDPTLDVLSFGVIPESVRLALLPTVDWRARSAAIEQVHAAVLQCGDVGPLLPHASDLIAFLGGLLDDPNFKIVLTALRSLGDMVAKLGLAVRPHLSLLVPLLLNKFADGKVILRQAIFRVLAQLMHIVGPKPVLSVAMHFLGHDHPRVREDAVNLVVHALLQFPASEVDVSAVAADLLTALADARPKVKYVTVEAYAVLAARFGSDRILKMLASYGLDDATLGVLAARFANPMLPVLGSDGLVDHIVANVTGIGSAPASRGGDGTGAGMRTPTPLPLPASMLRRSLFALADAGLQSARVAETDPWPPATPVGHHDTSSLPRQQQHAYHESPRPPPNPRPPSTTPGRRPPLRRAAATVAHASPSSSSSKSPEPEAPTPPPPHAAPHPTHPVRHHAATALPRLATEHGHAHHVASTSRSPEPDSGAAPPTATKLRAPRRRAAPPAAAADPSPSPSSEPPATTMRPLSLDDARALLESIKTAEWNQKAASLLTLNHSLYTPSLAPLVPEFVHAVIAQVSNLRSGVSRQAITTLGHLASHPSWTPATDALLELILAALLRKYTDAKDFMADAVDAALSAVVRAHAWSPRVAAPVLFAATDSKTAVVRAKAAAVLVHYLCGASPPKMGVAEAAKLVPALLVFLRDGAPGTRARGRRLVHAVAAIAPEWLAHVERAVSGSQWADLQRALAQPPGAAEGVADGEVDLTVAAAVSAAAGAGNASSPERKTATARSASASAAVVATTTPAAAGATKQKKAASSSGAAVVTPTMPVAELVPEEVLERMSSKDWKTRLDAVTDSHALLTSLPSSIFSTPGFLSRLMDAFSDRLRDGNTRVTSAALTALELAVVPALGRKIEPFVYTLFPAVAAAVVSPNAGVKAAGVAATDAMLGKIEPAVMLQALGNALTGGAVQASQPNPRLRPFVLERARGLVERAAPPIRLGLVLKSMLQPCLRILTNDRDRGSEAEAAAAALFQSIQAIYGAKALADGVLNAPGVTAAAEVMGQLRRCLPPATAASGASP
ncbi:hypothetical protein H9P43_006874 [Blastocladiella emersonii ATCC 22665]|nr:hypothetical protein H9P43_006874 [Blastocladiella emersonii ATCC 22665]